MRLACSIAQLKSRYDAVVVGSGYGGGVAASRLSRAGLKVCVLERGREYLAGEFPNEIREAARHTQIDFPSARVGNEAGLYDFRVNSDINLLVGCGLGGTSLLNASVVLRPDPRLFDDERWPAALRSESKHPHSNLHRAYALAEAMLKPSTYGAQQPPLAKLDAHSKCAEALGQPFKLTPIAVNFVAGVNHVGVHQNACVKCGDCISGCNYGAKNSTNFNYLPDAVRHGAEIFTEMKVLRIARTPDGRRWRVFIRPLSLEREVFEGPELFIEAEQVMLAAGSLGSTEILLRSQQHGALEFSTQLGQRFTGNGNVLAFAYDCEDPIRGVGFGHKDPARSEPVGPCITSAIDAREQAQLNDGMIIEEGSMPGVLSSLLPLAFDSAAKLAGVDATSGVLETLRQKLQRHGAAPTARTHTFLVMAHDESAGTMRLDADRMRISWPAARSQPVFKRIDEQLKKATGALGGAYVPNPMLHKSLGDRLMTVHPLGGCSMGDDAERGVVNDRCQVFSGRTGTDTHAGLYVCDGAVMPRSLGVNPLLTITALAERACQLLIEEKHMTQPTDPVSSVRRKSARRAPGLQFTERLQGDFFFDASARRQTSPSTVDGFEGLFTIVIDDLDELMSNETYGAAVLGSVTAPQLSPTPLTTIGGVFRFFVRDPVNVGLSRMEYRLPLASASGERFFLVGEKLLKSGTTPFSLWSDTTHVSFTVFAGDDERAPIVGRGSMRISATDFARQLTTLRARHVRTPRQAAATLARFSRFFASGLAQTYVRRVAPFRLHDPMAAPRKRRALRCGPGEVFAFTTADDVNLRLTRYRGGDKGPVMLVHGLGVSSRIFSLDTVDTNLVEYLTARGYDVWLLDCRTSIELPSASTRANADALAQYDLPAAIAQVLAKTGRTSLQVVAHCFGGTALTMALLSGVRGVRSAVISQVSAHFATPALTNLKSGLRLPSMLDALGVESLSAYRDARAGWRARLFDQVLRLHPQARAARSTSAVAKRTTFMYGQLWQLEQLNAATHDTLHETFSVANIDALKHLALLVRTGHLVDAEGRERYLPNVANLALPIRFIHGANNQTFLPESTEKTLDFLRAANGAHLYDRVVIPQYGHIDCILGKRAVHDVFPHIVEHLEKTGLQTGAPETRRERTRHGNARQG